MRSAGSLPHLLPLLAQLKDEGVAVHPIFLDATTAALVRRFSETRRAHPLADRGALVEAIELERELLAGLREVSTVLDTSQLRPTQLRSWMRELVGAPDSRLTLVFESFAYRQGVPLDADYVFDVRVLPNPHYVRELRPLTGRDAAGRRSTSRRSPTRSRCWSTSPPSCAAGCRRSRPTSAPTSRWRSAAPAASTARSGSSSGWPSASPGKRPR